MNSIYAKRAVAGARGRKKPKTQRPRPNRPPETPRTTEQTNADPAQQTPGTTTTGNTHVDANSNFAVEANTLQQWLQQNEVTDRSNTRTTGEPLTNHHETRPRLSQTPVGWKEHCCNVSGKCYYSRWSPEVERIEVKGSDYFETKTQRDRNDNGNNNDEFRQKFRELNLSRPTQHRYATRSNTDTIRMIAYQCGTCQVAFKYRTNLRAHRLTQHGKYRGPKATINRK